ncbi:VWD domain-containing protein [Spirosoma validum]|uniref:VWD domain-containing protein n=1 Tax=Spirosoma validum TaxID=2771355 RepID=A0A927B1Q5_9BACT|nr:VWD domain-containing protein [Spirosoma validum]MBD2753751.1 VWD domain-containing protein [Spirosoma validum]
MSTYFNSKIGAKFVLMLLFALGSCNTSKEDATNPGSSSKNDLQAAVYTLLFEENDKSQGVVLLNLIQTSDLKFNLEGYLYRYSTKDKNKTIKISGDFIAAFVNKSIDYNRFATYGDFAKDYFSSFPEFRSELKLSQAQIQKLINRENIDLAYNKSVNKNFLWDFLTSIIPSAQAQQVSTSVQGFVWAVAGILAFSVVAALSPALGAGLAAAALNGAGWAVAAYFAYRAYNAFQSTYGGGLFGDLVGQGGNASNAFAGLLDPICKALSGGQGCQTQAAPEDWKELIPKIQQQLQRLYDDLKNSNIPETIRRWFIQSTGDPHLKTADGYYYDFQGHGEFIAIKSTEDNFEVQARQEDVMNTGYVTVNTAIGIQTGGDIVSVTAKPFTLYVNDAKVQDLNFTTLPLTKNASVKKSQENGRDVYTVITTKNDAVKIQTNGTYWLDYSLSINDERKGKVIGLLGNYDGNKDNDLMIKDGKVIAYSLNELYSSFADSWRVKTGSLLHYDGSNNTDSYTKKNFPQKREAVELAKWQSALEACRKEGVTNEPFLTNCATDIYYTNDLAFANSSLLSQQMNPLSDPLVSNDVSYFKDVRITVSNSQGNLEDSCLVNLHTGEVYQLKDGAKNANKVDAIVTYYCGIDIRSPANIILCGSSCGVYPTYRMLNDQKWSVYRTGGYDSKSTPRDDNPTSTNVIAGAQWPNLTSSASLANLPWLNYVQASSNSSSTILVAAADNTNLCVPSYFFSQTLTRFVTQDGKRGVYRVKNFGKKGTGWWVTFDIKIQK